MQAIAGIAHLTEEKVTALLEEVPSELEERLNAVRDAASEFFASYENREWGNLGTYNDLVNHRVSQVDQYLKDSGIAEQLQAASGTSTDK